MRFFKNTLTIYIRRRSVQAEFYFLSVCLFNLYCTDNLHNINVQDFTHRNKTPVIRPASYFYSFSTANILKFYTSLPPLEFKKLFVIHAQKPDKISLIFLVFSFF